MDRKDVLSTLRIHSPDVLIVGGGINGIGTFRDLALQGVDVLLVEQNDFCSGASSASSHMAHGGIRYLENGEFGLVREAVQERNRMIENAPHLVRPLPTVIPIFKTFSGLFNAPLKFLRLLDQPAERGALVIKIGLMLYDAYTRRQGTVPAHKFISRKESLERFPGLNPAIEYTATYYDGQILSPERLAIELLLDAEAEGSHADAVNYVALSGIQAGKAVLTDSLTGQEFTVAPRLIINAAGPWIDPVNASLGLDRHYIGGTKGSHIVLDNPELCRAIGENEFFFENKDGRIVLIFPFHGKIIVGTTDIPVESADSVRCTDGEIDYFIDLVSHVFPNIRVKREQIVFRFAGVRPLEYSTAKTTGQISRDHSIHEDQLGTIPVYSLVGGKWTSFRAFSEQVTDKALEFLGLERKSDTKQLAIGGGHNYPKSQEAKTQMIRATAHAGNLEETRAAALFERYGTRALTVAKYLAAISDRPLNSRPDWTQREVEFLVEHEKVAHLDDMLLRRSTLAWLGEASLPLVQELAGILAPSLGWNSQQEQSEIQRTVEILKVGHGVAL